MLLSNMPDCFFRTVPSYNCCVCLIKMSTPFLMSSDSRIQVWWLSYSLTILLSGIHPEHNSWLVKRKRVEEYHSNIIGRREKEEHWYQMNSSSEVFGKMKRYQCHTFSEEMTCYMKCLILFKPMFLINCRTLSLSNTY